MDFMAMINPRNRARRKSMAQNPMPISQMFRTATVMKAEPVFEDFWAIRRSEFGKLDTLKAAALKEGWSWDLTSMPDVEKYAFLQNYVAELFGTDFWDKYYNYDRLSGIMPVQAMDTLRRLLCYHLDENPHNPRGIGGVWRRAMGYAEMSDEDILITERAKYPLKMTARECLQLSDSLWRMNIDSYPPAGNSFRWYAEKILIAVGMREENKLNFDRFWNLLLDQPCDYNAMKAMADRQEALSGNPYTLRADDLSGDIDFLLEWFGCGNASKDHLAAALCNASKM